jgi:hypothetical protein
MNKPLLALTIAASLALAAPLRAQDEGGENSKRDATPAAAAALNKGYKAEVAAPASEAEPEDAPPVESHGAPLNPAKTPPQRPLGAAERRAAASGGGVETAAAATGLSCDQSDPPLTGGVIREDRPNLLRDTNKIEWYAIGPNQALSVKFTAQKSGMGGFQTNEGTNARKQTHMANVSETPCDFDAKKAMAGSTWGGINRPGKRNPCYDFGPTGTVITIVPTSQALNPGTNTAHICWVKPGKTYYYNIRTFLPDPSRDQCAEDAKTMRWPGMKCGGLWQFIGGETAWRPSPLPKP